MKLGERFFTPWRIACIAVLVLSATVYAGALNGSLIWDDYYLVPGASARGLSGLLKCFSAPFLGHYYRPIVLLSFYFDHMIWGPTPFGYHQTNILIHVATTAAIIAFLRAAFPGKERLALLGGILFAVQPVQVSAVAWIGGRTDSLAALCMALFACTLVRGVRSVGAPRRNALIAAALAWMLAVFTKEQCIATLPLVPLGLICFGKQGEGERITRLGRRKATAPYFAIVAAYIACWHFVGSPLPDYVPKSLGEMATTGLQTTTYYALLLLAPTPHWMHTLCLGFFAAHPFWPLLAGVATIVGILAIFLRALRPEPVVSWLTAFAALTVIPVSNFVPLPSLLVVAPYRVGVAGVAVAGIFAWAFTAMFCERQVPLYKAGVLAASAMSLWCAGLTCWGASQWQSELTVFGTFVQFDPRSVPARLNLSSAELAEHRYHDASVQLATVLSQLYGSPIWQQPGGATGALYKGSSVIRRVRNNRGNRVDVREWLAAAFGRLGFARLDDHEVPGALTAFRAGLELAPSSAGPNEGMGMVAEADGQYKMAVACLKRSIAAGNDSVAAHGKLGEAYAGVKDWKDARAEFAYCADHQVWGGEALLRLADAEERLGHIHAAETDLERILLRSPMRPEIQTWLSRLRRGAAPATYHARTGTEGT